uniref:TIL domain-containing protein n=1 Tax=Anopheles funestus TaxID=62324 RepID=A0A4Y0BN94_ANOFN
MKIRIVFLLLLVTVVLDKVHGQTKKKVIPYEPCLATMKPKPTCPVNERYTCCKTCVEKTCSTRKTAVKCTAPCDGGCICKNGYIRATPTGKCIIIEDCGKPEKKNVVAPDLG